MDTQHIHAAATAAGIPPEALDHVAARVLAHFAGASPKPADLTSFIAALPTWDKLGMTQDAFNAMPATWRLAQGWAHQAPPVSRRPDTRVLTAEELKTLEGLSWAEYHTKGRQMQQSPPPEPRQVARN